MPTKPDEPNEPMTSAVRDLGALNDTNVIDPPNDPANAVV